MLVNFKTVEEFKKFKEYGIQKLSMLEDLETNIIENNSESPFFGVYFGDSPVARMNLYKKRKNSTVILKAIVPSPEIFDKFIIEYVKMKKTPIEGNSL